MIENDMLRPSAASPPVKLQNHMFAMKMLDLCSTPPPDKVAQETPWRYHAPKSIKKKSYSVRPLTKIEICMMLK